MILRVIVIGFTAFVAWIIHVANTGGSNIILQTVHDIPAGDKLGHFFVMGTFAYLVNLLLACQTFKLGRFRVLNGSVIVLVCVVLEEMTHMFIRTRTFSYLDLLSDFLGIVAFSFLAVKTYPYIAGLINPSHRRGLDASM